MVATHVKWFFIFRSKYKNYINVIRSVLNNEYPIAAILRNGETILFSNFYDVYTNIYNLNCDMEKDIVFIDGLTFYGGKTNGDIVGVFIKKEYGCLPVKNKIVLDVGASIGDSSIYFILRGATKVIALEPDLELYSLAKKNIELNGFTDKIELIRAGCSYIDHDDRVHSKPPLMTLQTILDNCSIKPDVLKMDCEGCEYDVILSSFAHTLLNFSFLEIEYHYGYVNIKKKLEEAGFKVRATGPAYFIQRYESATKLFSVSHTEKVNNTYYGLLYASK
jgi:hypothetical protein